MTSHRLLVSSTILELFSEIVVLIIISVSKILFRPNTMQMHS